MIKHKACAKPMCPNTFTGPGQYCDEHKPPPREDNRPGARQRGYNRQWEKARRIYLHSHPWCECEECKASKKPRRAEVVDHIKPHRGDMFLFWDKSNWRAMAKACHDSKTYHHDGGYQLGRQK